MKTESQLFERWNGAEKPLVSVSCISYNHEKYIEQALKSFLMQESNFPFEINIHDDASTDDTANIIRRYEKAYPKIIKPIYQTENQKSKFKSGMNPRFNFPRASGKYIAMCEGDDYWTDPLKLQKQVDFLEGNPEYAICFHNVLENNTFSGKKKLIPGVDMDVDYTIYDYVLRNRTATCSMFFNSKVFDEGTPKWFTNLPFGDLGIILLALKKYNEKGRVLRDEMGVYRIHKDGIHGKLHKNERELIKAYKSHITFTEIIEKKLLFEPKYKKTILLKKIKTYQKLASLNKKNNNVFSSLQSTALSYYYKLSLKFMQ